MAHLNSLSYIYAVWELTWLDVLTIRDMLMKSFNIEYNTATQDDRRPDGLYADIILWT